MLNFLCRKVQKNASIPLYKGAFGTVPLYFGKETFPSFFPITAGSPRTLLRASNAEDALSLPFPSALPAKGRSLTGSGRYSFRRIGSLHSIVDILAHPPASVKCFAAAFHRSDQEQRLCLPLGAKWHSAAVTEGVISFSRREDFPKGKICGELFTPLPQWEDNRYGTLEGTCPASRG